ncbi:inactive protein RESTRICTED TEV MOVEMENT 2 [Vigna radiata var. radiata]|uniref:Inactive protein RESTRICTED TEV MOVEMENT 2 n=1 Tax=Vigna radiata var. radiata TaxID=3916 RepID=A0A1S3UU15_VIGRR|nr:inactive protein RESTRICTED TEV MOVEMENT 2 [Vigna radiata var. radiata]
MEINAAEAATNRSYEDFEPYCKWLTQEGQAILEIHLKGFKKEQLKVETDNWGTLKIYGERPVNATNNKWCRFQKEIKISIGSDTNAIRAKFSHGLLFIAMPKEAVRELFIYGAETRKRTNAIKVAIAVVFVVALGTYVARRVYNDENIQLIS